ncbi:MAG: hypothetical protein ABIH21_04090 [Patescibacteria group bacterium]
MIFTITITFLVLCNLALGWHSFFNLLMLGTFDKHEQKTVLFTKLIGTPDRIASHTNFYAVSILGLLIIPTTLIVYIFFWPFSCSLEIYLLRQKKKTLMPKPL